MYDSQWIHIHTPVYSMYIYSTNVSFLRILTWSQFSFDLYLFLANLLTTICNLNVEWTDSQIFLNKNQKLSSFHHQLVKNTSNKPISCLYILFLMCFDNETSAHMLVQWTNSCWRLSPHILKPPGGKHWTMDIPRVYRTQIDSETR